MTEIFDLLNIRVRDAVKQRGLLSATLPQEKIIPIVLKGKNVLLLAPTGSGKTEAAVLPIFSRIVDGNFQKISLLYITPLRALNRDMLARLLEYGNASGLSVKVKHSDISASARREIVLQPPDVLITTPESLQIMLNGRRLREIIKNVKFVVIDEVHELAQNERGSQFSIALERLKKLSGGFQIVGLSATVGNPHQLARFINPSGETEIVNAALKKQIQIECEIPEIGDEEIVNKMGCDPQYAGSVVRIWNLINTHAGTLVFVNTRSTAEDIVFRLRMWLGEVPVLVHHGSLSRESRETAENDFKSGKVKALVCTSSLELGIDIGIADLVVQFNSPRQVNKMAQRIGRSGHSLSKISRGNIICNDSIELEEAVAIATLADESHFENITIRDGSMATLANQVMLDLNYVRKAEIDDIYKTLCAAYPYRDVTKDQFLEMLQFLSDIKKIWIDNNTIGKKGSILYYFIENISMIPGEKNFRVIDTVNKKFIGTFDERYVVNEVEPGSYFVMKGSTWRTIRIDDDRILVEPFPTPAIAPKWSGEDIPVLPDVVTRVSDLREGFDYHKIVKPDSRRKLEEWHNGLLATRNRIIVESRGGEIVFQSLLGTKGNFAFGEIMASLFTAITGESAEMDYSPYHVYFRLSRHISSRDVVGLAKRIEPDKIMSYITGLARRSRFFNGVFLYEARKFGVVSNKSDLSRIRLDKIISAYENTVLFKDAIRKMVSDYMDIESLKSLLRMLDSSDTEIIMNEDLSESSRSFLTHYLERVMPIKPTKVILEAVKNRLMNESMMLICTKCRNIRTGKINSFKSLRCNVCGSTLVAAFSEYERDRISDAIMNGNDRNTERRIIKNAHLIKEKGMTALITLAARGVGTETANRLLETSYSSEEDLLKAILNAEMEYSRNRRYWD